MKFYSILYNPASQPTTLVMANRGTQANCTLPPALLSSTPQGSGRYAVAMFLPTVIDNSVSALFMNVTIANPNHTVAVEIDETTGDLKWWVVAGVI